MDEIINPDRLVQRTVQQDTLRRGFLHQYCHKQGHRTCADRKQAV